METSVRTRLADGSFVDWSLSQIKPDRWRPHGIRYRIAWVQGEVCRVLFDNHHGKHDHCHLDGVEQDYSFESVEKLWSDFESEVTKRRELK